MNAARLVADIGGTNARFALADASGKIGQQQNLPVARFESFADALRYYLRLLNGEQNISEAVFGAAGPVVAGEVTLTNAPWRLREDELSRQLGGITVRIYNDLEAVAHALPYLTDEEVTPIGGACERPRRKGERMLAVNVGTGFGAATLLPRGNGWIACPSEAGHMVLGAVDAKEFDLLKRCVGGRAPTVEDLLSGPRMAALYGLCGGSGADVSAEKIFRRVPDDPPAAELSRWVTRWLGRVSGDLVLATSAWGGAFLLGGVVTGWYRHADAALFRHAFEDKGKMSARMANVFAGVINQENTALLGLARAPLNR